MSAPLFSKRHYEWLARWAGENLTEQQYAALAEKLWHTNSNFIPARFMAACDLAAAGGKVASL